MKVSLTPQSHAFIQRAIEAGRTADDVVNEALDLLQRRQEAWLREKRHKGEDVSEFLVYTDELIEEFEKYASTELVDTAIEEPASKAKS